MGSVVGNSWNVQQKRRNEGFSHKENTKHAAGDAISLLLSIRLSEVVRIYL